MLEDGEAQKDSQQELFWINHPSAVVWTEPIGKLILNFGALEFLSHLWVANLSSGNEIILGLAAEMNLQRRIHLILDLLRRSEIEITKQNEIAELWKKAQPFSELRNAVAHNPIIFGWQSATPEGEPDFIGVPNLKKRSIDLVVNHARLKQGIDGIAKLAQRLQDQLVHLSESQAPH